MRWLALVLVACLATGACEHGADALFPSTRRGWGGVVIVVGAAWIVTGAAIATDDSLSTGKRIGEPLAAAAIGTALIYAGWKLGRFGDPPPSSHPPAHQ